MFWGNRVQLKAIHISAATAIALGASILFGSPAIATKPDVSGNNAIAAYVGTGGLLLPDSFSGSKDTKNVVADCIGCTWRYTLYCFQGADTPCKHAVTSCPRGSLLYRVWFGQSANSIAVVGSVCWSSTTPVTRRQVERQVKEQVIRHIPALRPGFDPPGGSITSVPVIFWTGQPTNFEPPSFLLSGHSVSIAASPTWRWTWGDGASTWKSVAGAEYPSRQITHQYRNPRNYKVEVTAVWQAKYSVSDIGEFEVSGEVLRQSKSLDVAISSARTVLISHK